MKTYHLKIPTSHILTKAERIAHYDWRWMAIDEIHSLFVNNVKKKLGFSYDEYNEDMTDFEYSFWFAKSPHEYFCSVELINANDEFIEVDINFGVLKRTKKLFFTKVIESFELTQKFDKIIKEIIDSQKFKISSVSNSKVI